MTITNKRHIIDVKWAYDSNKVEEIIKNNFVIDIKPIIYGITHNTSVYTDTRNYSNDVKYMILIGEKNDSLGEKSA